MPNQIGQAYGLTVLSPVKQRDLHASAIRTYLASFDGKTSPFAKIQGNGKPTVHTARWVLIDNVANEGGHFHGDQLASKYLLLDVNLDTDHRNVDDGFLQDMIAAMPEEITTLYQHCVGFDGVPAFPAYIKKCQIETTFFFVDYAAEDRGKVVNVKKALAAQSAYVDIVAAGQSQPAAVTRQALTDLLSKLEWTTPPMAPVTHNAPVVQRDLQRQRIDVTDVQGNVLRGYKFPCARHLYFRVGNAAAGREALAGILTEVDRSGDWGKTKPPTALNLAFSHAGLGALGVPQSSLDRFPVAFRMGMKDRAEILGDSGSSHPDNWEAPFKDNEGVHVLASVYAMSSKLLEDETAWVLEELSPKLTLVGQQDAALLVFDGVPTTKEHFGFSDGFGTTEIDGAYLPSTPGSGKLDGQGHWSPLAPGELLYGYLDEANELPDSPAPPELTNNGTFLVYRKLSENVIAFRKYLDDQSKTYPGGDNAKELLAAKMVGRFRDGTPLMLSDKPDPSIVSDPTRNNDFRYESDPDGARCPMGAHIRRSRPRDALGFEGKVVDRRRIHRRGMAYGPWLPEDAPADDVSRGIVFMALNIDIERQFEFIQQQWLNYGNSFRQGNDKDIITGDHDGEGKAVIQASGPDGTPYLCTNLPRFVDMCGGEYFFVPGIRALYWITAPR